VFDLITPLDPTVVDTPIGGSTSFGAGPTGFQVLDDGSDNPLCVVSGYNVEASFDMATWLATGNTAPSTLDSAGVNGSTAGWGIDNNNFDAGEFFNWDFGPQALDDPDGAGGFAPPANPGLPNISFATFEFIQYTAGDEMYYVVHYTDGTFDSGQVPPADVAAGLWTFNADPGKFIADIEMYTPDALPGKVDLVSVGVTSSELDETIDFDVTLSDSDDDEVTGSFSVNIADGNTPSMALVMDQGQEEQLQKSAANSNTLTLAAAVAAAGMVESAAATPPADDQSSDSQTESYSTQVVEMVSVEDGGASSVSAMPEMSEAADAPGNSGGHSQASAHQSNNSIDAASNQQASDGALSNRAANDQGSADSSADAGALPPSVGMPSAAALQAVAEAPAARAVEQVVADALGQGDALTVDALLASLPGSNGELPALAQLASPDGHAVSGWDMAAGGAFGSTADMMLSMHAASMHHDAVQPAVNG
jgi:hypothetical protein